ncbi:MAG: hypothetical protein ACXV98_06270 [Ilumatobacteraceae bacterium]
MITDAALRGTARRVTTGEATGAIGDTGKQATAAGRPPVLR